MVNIIHEWSPEFFPSDLYTKTIDLLLSVTDDVRQRVAAYKDKDATAILKVEIYDRDTIIESLLEANYNRDYIQWLWHGFEAQNLVNPNMQQFFTYLKKQESIAKRQEKIDRAIEKASDIKNRMGEAADSVLDAIPSWKTLIGAALGWVSLYAAITTPLPSSIVWAASSQIENTVGGNEDNFTQSRNFVTRSWLKPLTAEWVDASTRMDVQTMVWDLRNTIRSTHDSLSTCSDAEAIKSCKVLKAEMTQASNYAISALSQITDTVKWWDAQILIDQIQQTNRMLNSSMFTVDSVDDLENIEMFKTGGLLLLSLLFLAWVLSRKWYSDEKNEADTKESLSVIKSFISVLERMKGQRTS